MFGLLKTIVLSPNLIQIQAKSCCGKIKIVSPFVALQRIKTEFPYQFNDDFQESIIFSTSSHLIFTMVQPQTMVFHHRIIAECACSPR